MLLEGWIVATVGWAGAWIPLLAFWPDLSRAVVGGFSAVTAVGTPQVIALGPALLAVGFTVTTITVLIATRTALRSTT